MRVSDSSQGSYKEKKKYLREEGGQILSKKKTLSSNPKKGARSDIGRKGGSVEL